MSTEAQPPVNPFAAQQQLLRERLHHLLSTLHPALQKEVRRALEERGKLLSQSSYDMGAVQPGVPAGSWSLLTLLIAQSISPGIDPSLASSIATATECFVCALDLLDDVEDEDQTSIMLELGAARALNISTALLALAQRALLQSGAGTALTLRLFDIMQEALLTATSGQHRDLLAEQREAHDFTREECIEIAAAKAGAIMRLACLFGAVCAGAAGAECSEFAEMAELLGIAHQLDNDAHDLYYLSGLVDASSNTPVERSIKTDLARGKKTLPVVLAARMREPLQRNHESSDGENQKDQERVQALREGIMTTWGISLLYRERARERFLAISSRRSVTPELRLLLGF